MSKIDKDKKLGMERPITRREFVGGVALSVGAGLMGPNLIYGDTPGGKKNGPLYPPGQTGLRGSHPGSFEIAHDVAFGTKTSGLTIQQGTKPDDNFYDLIVVGGGISGLAAAYFYAQQAASDTRILILENHDDFGGHAKRNEFYYQGKTLIGYGGSQSMQNPGSYSQVTKRLIKELGIDVSKFYTAYDQSFSKDHGLDSFVFFDEDHYGTDALVPMSFSGGLNARLKTELDKIPISANARQQLEQLLASTDDPFEGRSQRKRRQLMDKVSIEQFLRQYRDCDDEVIHLLAKVSLGYWAIGIDGLSVRNGFNMGFPGTSGLLAPPKKASKKATKDEPYIFHFPDGNASIARLLVNKLVPGISTAKNMEEIVTARFDYGLLDVPDQPVNIRLNSTVTHVERVMRGRKAGVEVTYVNHDPTRTGQGQPAETVKVKGRDCVLACYHRVIPHICPGLPRGQKKALQYGVRSPLVYTNVLIRNWRSMKELGLGRVFCPNGLFHSISMDFPVSLGNYSFTETPDDPAVLHLTHIPYIPGMKLDPKEQSKRGRQQLMTLTFEDYERAVRQQLNAILGHGGFNAADDVVAITVNRWPHGYAYEYISLWDKKWRRGRAPHIRARKTRGRIAIAGSDAAALAFADAAIDQAHRAVGELL
ncbi:MAG: NAD(P)-binding protein [bacterium]|nr:FAD-dependent oxidoreductase [Gammaproteobacteria bacterium]